MTHCFAGLPQGKVSDCSRWKHCWELSTAIGRHEEMATDRYGDALTRLGNSVAMLEISLVADDLT